MPTTRGHPFLKLFGVLVLILVVYGGVWAFDALVGAPWGYALGGRPTLTGRWTGQVDPQGGVGGPVWLEIERGRAIPKGSRHRLLDNFDYSRLGGHPTLHGTAFWCRSDGSASRYTISGWASRDGDVLVTFQLIAPASPHAQELHETRGHWSGTDLTLSGPMQLWGVMPGQPKSTRAAVTPTSVSYHPTARAPSDTSCSR